MMMKLSMLWCYIVMIVVNDVLNAMAGPAVIVCPNDLDCVVYCSPYTRNCYNARILCPVSNLTTGVTHNCTVQCINSLACVGTVIEAGNTVSTLAFLTWSYRASQNVEIITNGTEKVEITCGGQSSVNINVTSTGASSLTVLATFGNGYENAGIYGGTWKISNTQNVFFDCDTWGCTGINSLIDTVDYFHLLCTDLYGCVGNTYQIKESTNVLIESILLRDYYLHDGVFTSNQVNISDVKLVAFNITNGTANGSFALVNVENFLYKTGPLANPFITWNIQNVSNPAIESWNATSFWIVDGIPIQKQYVCPNDRDCNIRVDSSIPANFSMSVLCPMDSISHSHTTCQFYCSSPSGCGMIDLRVQDVTNAALYFNNPASQLPFSLNASAWNLTNVNTTLSITCGFESCINNTFNISGYDDINVAIIYVSGCSDATFNVTGFSHMTMMSNELGLANAMLSLTDGDLVQILPNPEASGLYQLSDWKFYNIGRVEIECARNWDCTDVSFHSISVGEVSAVCDFNDYASGPNCYNTVFNNSEDTSFSLTCSGDYGACENIIIQYNGSNPDLTSLELSCYLSDTASLTCYNISIIMTDNKIGFDAMTFLCEVASDNEACEMITVSCGADDILCRCPVERDDDDHWYCNGECGSLTCPSDEHEKLSTYAIAGIALASLIVGIGIVVCIKMVCCKKKGYEGLLDTPKNNYTNA